MQKFDLNQFNQLLESSSVKPRLRRELRFTTSVAHINDEDWKNTELLAIKDRSGNKGALLVSIQSGLYLLPFEFNRISPSASTGRASAIICDICMTWQSGTRAGSISFTNVKGTSANVGYLCCKDLACSKHVRTLTPASKVSRAQLREDLDNEQRVERLRNRLETLVQTLQAKPVENLLG